MSPGATFERVYNELKRMLVEGELPPGSPIEPALISKQIASSITPIRDALHRLTGERLVEAPSHNGFRVPLPTEAALRDLYAWNGQLLRLAVRCIKSSPPPERIITAVSEVGVARATADLFVAIAHATGSLEHIRTLQQLNDRLASFRQVERQVLHDVAEEYGHLAERHRQGDQSSLTKLLTRYTRRRILVTSKIVAAIQSCES